MASPKEPAQEAQPVWKPCFVCGERFDETKDPNHRENCRESVRP